MSRRVGSPKAEVIAAMPVTEAQVLEALRPVQDPELHRSIVDLDMVRSIAVAGPQVAVTVALTVEGCPLRSEITRRVDTAVTALDGVDAVDLDFTVMTDDERAALRTKLHGDPAATAGSQPAHGHAEGRAIPFADPDSKTRVLLVASGKGPPAGGDRPDARAARVLRRPLHLHGLLRPGGPAGHLAGTDAAQGARAVPHRRVLGRARLPPRRPAAGHGRHLDQPGPVPAPRRGLRGDHAAAGRAAGGAAGRVHGPEGQPRGARRP